LSGIKKIAEGLEKGGQI